ncbi:MAG: hypothetical protein Kow0092_03370 [Deferrisomatales bacterium]
MERALRPLEAPDGGRWLDLFRRATEVVSSSLDLADLERHVLEFLKDLLGAEAASLLLRDETTGDLSFTIALGGAGSSIETVRLPRGQGIAGWVAESGQSLWVPDASRDPRFCAGMDEQTSFRTEAVLAVPLRVAGRVIGVVEVLNRRGGGPFPRSDLDVLEALSGLVAMAVDHATRIAEIEAHRRDLERRVEEKTRELRWAETRLFHAQKMAGLGRLAAGVAHELNNPLCFLGSNVERLGEYAEELGRWVAEARALLEGRGSDPIRRTRWLEEASEDEVAFLRDDAASLRQESREGLARMQEIVAKLGRFVRLDAPRRDEIDPSEWIRATLEHWRAPDGVRVDLEAPPTAPVWGDAARLAQCVLNCLDNAAEAVEGRPAPRIRVRVRGEHRGGRPGVAVEVVDNGRGMDPDTADRAFEPFFTTKPVGAGPGLGLSEVYAVVADHGGQVGVESRKDEGTRVCLWIPRDGEEGAP